MTRYEICRKQPNFPQTIIPADHNGVYGAISFVPLWKTADNGNEWADRDGAGPGIAFLLCDLSYPTAAWIRRSDPECGKNSRESGGAFFSDLLCFDSGFFVGSSGRNRVSEPGNGNFQGMAVFSGSSVLQLWNV